MKRALYIFSVLLVSLLLVAGIIIAALMSDRVETAAVQLATSEWSRTLGTKARIGAVEYRFPACLQLHDIYIEDKQHDTLLYLNKVDAHFRPLALRENKIQFAHLGVSIGVAHIYQLQDSTYNYQFLVDAFRKEKKQEPLRSLISIEDIRLDSLHIRYNDYDGQLIRARMDLHQLTDKDLDAEIRELNGQLTHNHEQLFL